MEAHSTVKKPQTKMVVDLSPAEAAERAARGIALDVELQDYEVAARQTELDAMRAEAKRRPGEQAPKTDAPAAHPAKTGAAASQLAGRLGEFAGADHAAVQSRDEQLRAAVKAISEPLAARAQKALSTLGALRSRHLDAVQAITNVDLRAVLRRMPLKVEYRFADTVSNHDRLTFLVRHAPSVVGGLTSEFPDLKGALKALSYFETSLYAHAGGATGYLDVMDGVPSPAFRQAKVHAEHWVKRVEGHVAGVQAALDKFYALQARVADDVAALGPLDQVEAAPRAVLVEQLLPTPPRSDSSSVVDFDVREHPSTWVPQHDSTVTRVGADGEGTRVNALGHMQKKTDPNKARVYGIADGGAA